MRKDADLGDVGESNDVKQMVEDAQRGVPGPNPGYVREPNRAERRRLEHYHKKMWRYVLVDVKGRPDQVYKVLPARLVAKGCFGKSKAWVTTKTADPSGRTWVKPEVAKPAKKPRAKRAPKKDLTT